VWRPRTYVVLFRMAASRRSKSIAGKGRNPKGLLPWLSDRVDPQVLSPTGPICLMFVGLLLCLLWALTAAGTRKLTWRMKRYIFLVALCIVSLAEFKACFWTAAMRLPAVVVMMVATLWGHLDAVLRFPVLHDPESFFVIKVCACWLLKILCLALGFKELTRDSLTLLAFIVVEVVVLPGTYLLSLPLDDCLLTQRAAAYDVTDVDIAVRVWTLIIDGRERAALWHAVRRKFRRMVAHMKASPGGTRV